MAKLEFVDGEPPIIRVSGDLGPGDELQGNEYKPFEMDYVFQRDKDIAYKPHDGEKCYIIAVHDKKKIAVVEWVFDDSDLVANGFSENGCFFKTREEADRIAEGIERETKGRFSLTGEEGRMEKIELKPCPFCGCKIKTAIEKVYSGMADQYINHQGLVHNFGINWNRGFVEYFNAWMVINAN